MKCRKCQNIIPDGDLFCPFCGCEVQIVPDYSPLDEMLAAQIRLNTSEEEQKKKDRSQSEQKMAKSNKIKNVHAQKRATAMKKRRRKIVIMLVSIVVLLTLTFWMAYKNSYNGMISFGYKHLEKKEYEIAQEKFYSAIEKRKANPKAYVGYYKTMIASGHIPAAEEFLNQAISDQPENYQLYQVVFDFYLETNSSMKIPELLSEASDSVVGHLDDYVVKEPEFSLDPYEVYDDVQELSMSGQGTIYYTLNGENPDNQSSPYQEPIQIREGETKVRAVVYNKMGVPSLVKTAVYTVELPMIDAPAVSPSTGQYSQPEKITIKVPEGYDAYYELDGSDPTAESEKYTGPIDMPSGDILFKAVLVDGYGRVSAVTTRNYIAEKIIEE